MTRNAICQQIATDVGMAGSAGAGTTGLVEDLARQARCEDEIMTRPKFVAREITALLDDMVRNP